MFRDSSSDTGSSESAGQGRRKYRPLTQPTVKHYWTKETHWGCFLLQQGGAQTRPQERILPLRVGDY